MADRASINQVVQIGMEVAPGTGVAATKKLPTLQIEMGPETDIKKYRGTGYKYPSVAALNKEWVSGSISGPLTFNEIVYLLCGCVKNVAGAGAGAFKTWTFSPATTTEDTIKTFTIEQGSAVRAHKFAYGLVTGVGMKFNREGAEVTGQIIGAALQDGIVLSAGASEVAIQPVTAPMIAIKLADTAAGLAAAPVLGKALSAEFSITDRFGPVWVLDQSTDFGSHVEIEPKGEAKLLVEADAEGMGLLTTMRANTAKFMRIEATGPQIGVGPETYLITVDLALRVMKPSPLRDEDGIFAIEWGFEIFHDVTWGKAFNIVVVNESATL